MDIIEIIKVSKDSLMSNKVRSFLTMLGVIIGVAAVILLVSIGEGARTYIHRELGNLGTNILIVVPGKTSAKGGFHPPEASTVRKLIYDDAQLIKRRSKHVDDAVPVMLGSAKVKYLNQSRDNTIVGSTETYFSIRNLKVDSGRFITESEVDAKRKVCILGRTVKRDLFGDKNALGALVSIGDSKYRVVGVMEKKGVTLGIDFDDIVFIPTTTAQELFDTDRLFNITIKVKSASEIHEATEEIKQILIKRHAGKEDFTVMSQDEMLGVMTKILNIMTAVLAGIAAISLVVGGIGIMNIMLVSVRERTREIGIRKALGAKNSDILLQFLVESMTLSIIGGTGGILFAGTVSFIIPYFIEFLPTQLELWSIVLAFLFSAAVGIFFGVYPARKASLYD
ncbi:MAG: ABC transporter permease, partial [Thermodesulfovibrionales bacterium]|nr:ABC transporter permease [Thermodesulfovibrionales bacterium]